MDIILPGLIDIDPNEEFQFEYSQFPENMTKELRRWLKIIPMKNKLTHPDDALNYQVLFEPMKPFKLIFDMIFYKQSGGRWK